MPQGLMIPPRVSFMGFKGCLQLFGHNNNRHSIALVDQVLKKMNDGQAGSLGPAVLLGMSQGNASKKESKSIIL